MKARPIVTLAVAIQLVNVACDQKPAEAQTVAAAGEEDLIAKKGNCPNEAAHVQKEKNNPPYKPLLSQIKTFRSKQRDE